MDRILSDPSSGTTGVRMSGLIDVRRLKNDAWPDAFAAARVADDRDAIEIDFAVEPMAGRRVPGAKLLEVLEVHDAPRVVFTEVAAVQEVDVDRGADDTVRGEQLTQIEIPRRRVLEWPVVPVGEHHQRERPPPAWDADVPVQRHAGVGKRPRRSSAKVCKRRNVEPRRDEPGSGRVVDVVLGEHRHGRVITAGRCINDRVEKNITTRAGFCSSAMTILAGNEHLPVITTELAEANAFALLRRAGSACS